MPRGREPCAWPDCQSGAEEEGKGKGKGGRAEQSQELSAHLPDAEDTGLTCLIP